MYLSFKFIKFFCKNFNLDFMYMDCIKVFGKDKKKN